MARKSDGPWFWVAKNAWYATVDGRRVHLGVKDQQAEAEANRAWHRAMAEPPKPKPIVVAVAPTRDATVTELADAFLLARKATVKPATHYVYACLLKRVATQFGDSKAVDLRPNVVLAWLRSLTASQSTRSDIAGVLSAACRWAEAEGLIAANPLKAMRKPGVESRGVKSVVTADGHAVLLAAASATLRPVLALLHSTGARPSEICRLTAADVDLANGVAVIADHKTSAHGHSRFLVLTPLALAILRPLIEAGKAGPLLRNERGNPWHKDALGHAMRRLSKTCGIKAIAYGYRHTFATDALASGVPDATVAALLGHSGTTMLHKHYSHLCHQATTMKQAAAKVRG